MLRGDVTRKTLWTGLGLTAMVGAACAVLVAQGNPGNMGICGACFLRDLAGTLGLISGEGPRIFRPEVAGVVLGALAWVLALRKYAARSGSFAVTRLFFGVWMAFGALVFLGCPFRMLQRLGGGDLNAAVGAAGFVAGVGAGAFFERRGLSVGRTAVVAPAVGILGPVAILMVLVLFLAGGLLLGPGPGEEAGPPHAPWLVSMAVALLAGAAMSGTGFCAVSAARQVFLRPKRMLAAAGLLVAAYALVSLATGRFKLGFDGQPVAHTEGLWNALAMGLVGLTGVLAGGCPVRQMVMAGEGNGDAFLTVVGLVLGGGLAHNLGLASSGAGTTPAGRWAVIAGLVVSLLYAAAMTARRRPG
jgi:YedE family putative selenium metabolism protein